MKKRDIPLYVILMVLPILAALGHDIYLFFANNGYENILADASRIIEEKGPLSMFAAVGFIWTQYHPESYQWVAHNVSPETWSAINAILAQKAVFVAIFFAVMVFTIRLIIKSIRSSSEGKSGSMQSKNTLRKQGKKMEYKRR